MFFRMTTAALLAALTLTVPATMVQAQEAQSPEAQAPEMQMPSPEAPAASDFTDEQITSFAVTYLQIREIAMGYEQSSEEAADDEARRALVEKAQLEMIEIIDATEVLTVEDYNGINAAAAANPEFANKIQSELDQLRS